MIKRILRAIKFRKYKRIMVIDRGRASRGLRPDEIVPVKAYLFKAIPEQGCYFIREDNTIGLCSHTDIQFL